MEIVTDNPKPVRTTSAPIVHSHSVLSPENWRQELSRAVRQANQLCELLQLPANLAESIERADQSFELFVPRPFLSRIRRGDLSDPLLRQVLPTKVETLPVAGFGPDPVLDQKSTIASGLIQKYQGRVLLIAATRCAVNCRYCFRREFPYETAPHGITQWKTSLQRIAGDPSIEEVILSGGDPLMLVDESLGELIAEIEQISHVRRLRIHTRLPVMIPTRITAALLNILTSSRLVPFMVLHINHAQEIDEAVVQAIARLTDHGIPVLNQSVLLAGVNDNADVLHDLCQLLVNLRVIPYYLHQLDRVQGAAHFEVPIEQGKKIMYQLHARLPGYAVPRYVIDDGSPDGKTIIV
jgi:EF-P beta-lysylation protein EpmB